MWYKKRQKERSSKFIDYGLLLEIILLVLPIHWAPGEDRIVVSGQNTELE